MDARLVVRVAQEFEEQARRSELWWGRNGGYLESGEKKNEEGRGEGEGGGGAARALLLTRVVVVVRSLPGSRRPARPARVPVAVAATFKSCMLTM